MGYGVRVFDREGTLARLDGDRELLGELVELFLKDAPGLLDATRKAVQACDAGALRRTSHTFRGAAGAIGAADCERLALDLENMGRSGDLAAAPKAIKQLAEQYRLLVAALEEQLRG